MEKELLTNALETLGPWGALAAFILYQLLKTPVRNFFQNLKFHDIISFRKHKIQVKELKGNMHKLKVAINKEKEIGDLIDKLRDKYDFKYTYVSLYSNGEYDLTGMSKYKFSIDYEKCRYNAPSIRHLYQNQSLVPYFPLIASFTDEDKREFVYTSSLLTLDLEELEPNHPLKSRLYTHSIKTMYILLILKEVPISGTNSYQQIPIGDLTCTGDNLTKPLNDEMLSDLYMTQKSILEVLNKYPIPDTN